MPKDTFIKLPEDKKEKILKAAKKEFSRTSIDKASIQNIIQDAGIPRGSFYQYFEDKEDILYYLMKEHANKMNEKMEDTLRNSNGDIFQMFIKMYEYFTTEHIDKEDKEFIKNIFQNLRTDDYLFFDKIHKIKPKNIVEFYDLVDKNKYKIETKEDFKIITKMLCTITEKAVAVSFRYSSKEEAKNNYLKQLEILKYGIQKNN